MISLHTYLLVATGSAIGGFARYVTTASVGRWLGTRFPWGTLAVNVLGATLLGLLIGLLNLSLGGAAFWFLVIGICGSYTTVSSFSLQTLELLRQRRPVAALANTLLSLLLCLLVMAAALRFTSAPGVLS
ncbi:MAG: CrcB family protein [Ectothiorhodospiraceae bacterium]|nr:CrcB family protein [Ectothiorhodospiraceae bacterium]MCH8505174.1 CrcB family protein [Ectothiorhodospiraceae bacterium]